MQVWPGLSATAGVHDWGDRLLRLDFAMMRTANEAGKADTPEKMAVLAAEDRSLAVQRAHANVMLEAHYAQQEAWDERRRKARADNEARMQGMDANA